ncbi:MAG: ribose ABC transporter [Gammaproteobacteria bacterium]|nr:ribose ABC transporter [Gammaproteobacteria bacterium]
MLKNLDPLLGPELIYTLSRMGHGDEIAVVDANFPAEANARRLVRLDGVSATDVLEAIVSVLPIDTYVDDPVNTMAVVGDPEAVPDITHAFRAIIRRHASGPVPMRALERDAFYARSREAFAIVATGECRLYGNVILTKGVVESV